MLKRFSPTFLYPSVIALIFWSLGACQSDSSQPTKCKYGKPTAIFHDTMQTVAKHFFQIKDNVGIEMVVFNNKLLLEIEQSGCNDIHQQFSFVMFGKFKNIENDDVWKQLAIKHFRDLAQISSTLTAFNGWADAIESVKDKLKLSEPIEVEGKTQVRIDKIVSEDKATLVVQFSSQ
ncbi:MAG: hypothetical protein JNL70_14240 [Saprospiraceae bacterium]|nr:hypothetical protein [Saprospiraceae bacterium]